jgi:hypothetical protein
VVVCDVSASVAQFALFTLMLVIGLRDHFDKVRVFTFIDHVHEVTDLFTRGADVAQAMHELRNSPGHEVAWRRTDYGRTFTELTDQHSDAFGARTSLLILGDARSNYLNPEVEALRVITRSVKRSWWLNPEGREHWGSLDSLAPHYDKVVRMKECRNLRQLGEFVRCLT